VRSSGLLTLALLAAAGCWTNPTDNVTPDVRLACDTDADCPPDWGCRALDPPRCLPNDGAQPALAAAPGWVRDRAGAGQTLEARLVFDSRLLFAPDVVASFSAGARPFLVDDGGDVDDATWTARYTVSGDEGEGAAAVRVVATSATTGAEGSDDAGEVIVDLQPPALAADATISPAEASTGTEVTVSLTFTEALAVDPQVELRIEDQAPVPFTHASGEGLAHSFTYTPDGTEPSGAWPVVARAVDVAGNDSGPLDVGLLTIDLTAPGIVPGTAVFEISGAPDAAVDQPDELTVGSSVSVSFVADDDLGAPPVVVGTVGASTLAFALESADGRVYRLAHTLVDAEDGVVTVSATLRDTAGNEATRVLALDPPLTVDTSAHEPPTPEQLALMSYARAPWGASDTGGAPAFEVSGQAGAVEPRAHVLLLDDLDPEVALVVGRGRAADDGSFAPISLNARDRQLVYVWPHDVAGNPAPTPEPVGAGRWTATPAGRVPGDDVRNPHRVVSRPDAPTRAPPQLRFGDVELSGDGLGVEGDGVAAEIDAIPYWRRVAAASTLPTTNGTAGALAYDSWRGVTVFFDATDARTWEFDGRTWSEPQTVVRPPEGSLASLVFDSWRGVTLLRSPYAGFWAWDGVTWTELPLLRGVLPPHNSVFAFDDVRGVGVEYGRPIGALGWPTGESLHEWDGESWTVVPEPSVHPPRRDHAAMAAHPTLGVLVYGGCADPTTSLCDGALLEDTWSWDGASWTEHQTTNTPGPRVLAELVWDPVAEHAVLLGGRDAWVGEQTTQPPFAWNGTDWTPAGLSGDGPTPWLGAVWDAGRQRLVGVGGYASVPLRHLERAPEGWIDPTVQPPPRDDGAIVWDSAREVLVLFGGDDGSTEYDDTWEFDGLTWRQRFGGPGPYRGDGNAFVYDPVRSLAVLHGPDGTWEWNGTTWAAGSSGPGPRRKPSMVFDSAAGEVVLSGGWDPNDSDNRYHDVWAYSAAGWAEVTTTGDNPTANEFLWTFAYDPSRDVTVAVWSNPFAGGGIRTLELSGTTWTDTGATGGPYNAWFDPLLGRVRGETNGGVVTWRPEEPAPERRWLEEPRVAGTPVVGFTDAAASRPDDGAFVRFGQGELWRLDSPAVRGASLEVEFDARAPGPAYAASWDVVDVRLIAGAGAAPTAGAALEVFRVGAWVRVASNDAGHSAPAELTWTADETARRQLHDRGGALVRVVSVSDEAAQLALDYAEMVVDHSGVPAVCGDGRVDDDEECDDGDVLGGDGCSATCTEEWGFVCDTAEPTACESAGTYCSDAVLQDAACTCGCNAVDQGCPVVGGSISDCDDFSSGCPIPLEPVMGDLSRCVQP
jgi:cysteine-rich repeat protein